MGTAMTDALGGFSVDSLLALSADVTAAAATAAAAGESSGLAAATPVQHRERSDGDAAAQAYTQAEVSSITDASDVLSPNTRLSASMDMSGMSM